MKHSWAWSVWPTLVLVLCLSGVAAEGRAENWTVMMQDFRFDPDTLTIAAGDSVTWINQDAMQHTTTSGLNCQPDGRWDSGLLNQGEAFGEPFPIQGTYPYFCIPHCQGGMTGAIIVTPNTPTEDNTWGRIKALYTTEAVPR